MTSTDTVLSLTAVNELREQLDGLPWALVYARGAMRPSSSQPAGARVSGGTRTAPLPCNLDALNLFGPGSIDAPDDNTDWPAPTVLHAWAGRTARESGKPPADRTLNGSITYLQDQLDWTVQQPWAVEYAASIGDLWGRLQRYQPVLRSVRRAYTLSCPGCHHLSLVEVERVANIVCTNRDCRRELSEDEYNAIATPAAKAIEAAA